MVLHWLWRWFGEIFGSKPTVPLSAVANVVKSTEVAKSPPASTSVFASKSVASDNTSPMAAAASSSTAARAIHTVRHHVPLIRFPKARPQPNYAAAQQNVQGQNGSGVTILHHSLPHTAPVVSEKPPIGKTPRGSGIDERLLPRNFKRRLLTNDEIEAINIPLVSQMTIALGYLKYTGGVYK